MTRQHPRTELRIKRARGAVDAGDGLRILVDRLWPRGVSKETLAADAWLKEIAPGNALRQWFNHDPERWDGFRERYFRELEANPEALDALRTLLHGTRHATLLYDARDETHNNAVALREYLQRHL